MKTIAYQKLAFGDDRAAEYTRTTDFADDTRRVLPSLIDYDASEPRLFRARSAATQVNELRLYAASMPNAQTFARVGGDAGHTFCFHFKR